MNWWRTYDDRFVPALRERTPGDKFALKRGLCPGFGHRIQGFRMMFELLLATSKAAYNIVETGTCRNPGNWKDGQSAVLFTAFVDHFGGTVRSVDIDPTAVARARSHVTSPRFEVYCQDSVTWLAQQTDLDQVHLFYLDSWDVKWENDRDSAEHHLREFQTIEPYLRPGSVVAIDDNAKFLESGHRTGKGRRIVEYLESQHCQPVYDRYQIIYQF